MRGKLIANGLLALAVVLAAWVVGKELWEETLHRGGEEGEIVAVSLASLGMKDWLAAEPRLKGAGDFYDVPVLDATSGELFKIKVDAGTGQLVGKENRRYGAAAGFSIDSAWARRLVAGVLPSLRLGPAVHKGEQPFSRAPVLLGDVELARLKIDNATGRPLAAGEKPAGEEQKKGRPERVGGEKLKLVPKRWVVPLGWLAVIIAVTSSLYYSWKRSLLSPIRAAEGEARRQAAAALRRTLRWHEVFGALAIATALFHIANSWHKLKLSVSWLAMGMMATVFISGAFGEVLARSQAVRAHWRRFHVPYTVLFFTVLLVHLLLKGEILGD